MSDEKTQAGSRVRTCQIWRPSPGGISGFHTCRYVCAPLQGSEVHAREVVTFGRPQVVSDDGGDCYDVICGRDLVYTETTKHAAYCLKHKAAKATSDRRLELNREENSQFVQEHSYLISRK